MPVCGENGEKFLWGLEKAGGIGGYPGPNDMLSLPVESETFPHFSNVGGGLWTSHGIFTDTAQSTVLWCFSV